MKDHDGNQLKTTGNCFENCAKWVIGDPSTDLVVIHAIVTGQNHIKGIEYSHAFLLDPIANLVYDVTVSLDKPLIVPAQMYYDIGNVRNTIVYTRADVLAQIQEHEHWGPWDESISTEADQFCEASG